MRTRRGLLAAAVLLAIAAGSAGAWAQGTGAERLTFTIGYANDMDSWNPFVAVEAPSYDTLNLVYETLLELDQESASPSPGIAESWETSPDGLTWTFTIREGMAWHDGEPLTARDVAYTYKRVIEDEEGCCTDYFEFVERVEAVDDRTLVIETSRPNAQMLWNFTYILPEHVWSGISKKDAKTFENFPPVGSGPFELVEWERGQFWRLEASGDYWNGNPTIDELIFRVFQNDDAMVQALKQGEIDAAESINPSLFGTLEDDPNIEAHAAVIPSFSELAMNAGADETTPGSDGHPALKDVRVRQAIAHAVDKQTLVDRVLLGYGEVGSTLVPPTLSLYHAEPSPEDAFAFDLDEANRILDEAGYADTDGDGVREMPNGGRPLRFRLFVRSEKTESVKNGQFIKPWLAEIGIDTTVSSLTDTKLTDVIFEGNFDLFIWGWFPGPDPDFILSVMTCGQRPPDGIWSDSFYCDPAYDEMYREQKTMLDEEERAAVIQQMQLQVYRDAPYVILYYDNDLQAYRKDRWTGFEPQPEPDGFIVAQYGSHSYRHIRPVSVETPADGTARPEAAPPASSTAARGLPAAAWVGIVAGAVILVLVVMLVRRSRPDEDRA